jgi:hypothetical protein
MGLGFYVPLYEWNHSCGRDEWRNKGTCPSLTSSFLLVSKVFAIPGILYISGNLYFNMSSEFKIPVHVEVQVRSDCASQIFEIKPLVSQWIQQKCALFQNGPIKLDNEIRSYIESITVADLPPSKSVSFWQAEVCLHLFRLGDQGPESDFMDGEEELPAAEQWELPNALLHNLWDSIVIETKIKLSLLNYCSSSIRFSEARIDTDIISWNRMILLHGPPGNLLFALHLIGSDLTLYICCYGVLPVQVQEKRQYAKVLLKKPLLEILIGSNLGYYLK